MKNLNRFFIDNKSILISLFIFSILVYGYAGLNTIINLDGVDDFVIKNKVSGYDLYLSVGRWGWSIIGLFFDYYPSSFLCLILNSVLFSMSGVYLGKILNVKNNLFVVLITMILIAFPTNIIAYTYLPWQFSIGIGYFVSIYSVYKIKNYKKITDGLIAALLISFATGIYQTFLAVIIVLCVVSLIISLGEKIKSITKELLKYLVIGIIGVILYVIIVKLSTFIFGIEMNSYQGANVMFELKLSPILTNLKYTFFSCFSVDFGAFFSNSIHSLLLITLVVGIIIYAFRIKMKYFFIYAVLLFILLISPKILNFIKPFQFYHLITLLPYTILFVGGCAFLTKGIEEIKNKKISVIVNRVFITILCIISFSLLISANKAFVMSRQATEASFHYINRLQLRIESLEGYDNLPNPKKYMLYRDYVLYDLEIFPASEYTYIKEQGITWTFVLLESDMIPAFNLLGENVVSATVTDEEYNEIKELAKGRKRYPNKEGIFIYKDIVVILPEK